MDVISLDIWEGNHILASRAVDQLSSLLLKKISIHITKTFVYVCKRWPSFNKK